MKIWTTGIAMTLKNNFEHSNPNFLQNTLALDDVPAK